jgi:nucleoid-associated protein YgaU
MPLGVGASQVSAYIQVLPPGAGLVTFPFDPEEYTVRAEADWHATPQPNAKDGPVPQFHGVKPAAMDVKILLDSFAVPPSPPEPAIAILRQAMGPSEASLAQGRGMAAPVMFGWGTNIVLEQAFIKSMSITYKRFLLGNPVRAEVTVTLEAIPSVVAAQNPTSGGLATRRTRTVVAGDTLASIAYQEYGDAARWRAIAAANGIDDPMRLAAGTVLLVPEPREAELLA